jgi:broad-specificity NMP kinase
MNWNSIAALVIHGVPVCIYGNPGVGKTSRMGQLFDQMAQMMLLSLISQSKTTPVEVEKKLLQALFG